MATFKILDTGYVYYKNISSQTQLPVAQRAGYTGTTVTAFTLQNASDGIAQEANVDSPTTINATGTSNTTLASVGNLVLKVGFILKRTIVTSGYDINNVIQLHRLQNTHGLKILYLSVNETVDGQASLLEAFGERNVNGEFADASPSEEDGTVSTTTKYLVGRVTDLKLTTSPKGTYWNGSFNFIVTDGN